MRVYLAGPINGCSDSEAKDWRETLKVLDQFIWIDPMERDYRGVEAVKYREVVDLDKRDILSCDVIVVMFAKPSVGTSMEILFAWENGIPVILIDQSKGPLSPWLIYHSTSIVNSLEEAMGVLCKL